MIISLLVFAVGLFLFMCSWASVALDVTFWITRHKAIDNPTWIYVLFSSIPMIFQICIFGKFKKKT